MSDNDTRRTEEQESAIDSPTSVEDAPAEDTATAYAPPAEEPAVIDDPDTPIHPDEQTVAETEAAYEAIQVEGGIAPVRKYEKPRSILILVLVVLGIFGLGVYAVIWSDHLRQKNEKIELREIQRRHVMSQWQQRNFEIRQRQYELAFPGEKIAPANSIYKPLSPSEKSRYDGLMALYGSQFEPNENEKALIAETNKLIEANRPATRPATAETDQK